ncbi:MAG TPA: dual specificity protein phosphatase [Anaerolineales bacterium]|nr:dual specificity protein phosphatase [Anaerolineales bacterium]
MDYSKITEDLFIGTTPTVADYEHLRELGVRLVINMRWEFRPPPDLHNPPLRFLWLRTFDSPLIPIPMRALQRGARAALEIIHGGGRVYVHCAAGRHRGVAMGSAVLIAQGHDPHEAMQLIRERRLVADPHIFYIRRRILRFAREWERERGGTYSGIERQT